VERIGHGNNLVCLKSREEDTKAASKAERTAGMRPPFMVVKVGKWEERGKKRE
jgi:hypothetical protein